MLDDWILGGFGWMDRLIDDDECCYPACYANFSAGTSGRSLVAGPADRLTWVGAWCANSCEQLLLAV